MGADIHKAVIQFCPLMERIKCIYLNAATKKIIDETSIKLEVDDFLISQISTSALEKWMILCNHISFIMNDSKICSMFNLKFHSTKIVSLPRLKIVHIYWDLYALGRFPVSAHNNFLYEILMFAQKNLEEFQILCPFDYTHYVVKMLLNLGQFPKVSKLSIDTWPTEDADKILGKIFPNVQTLNYLDKGEDTNQAHCRPNVYFKWSSLRTLQWIGHCKHIYHNPFEYSFLPPVMDCLQLEPISNVRLHHLLKCEIFVNKLILGSIVYSKLPSTTKPSRKHLKCMDCTIALRWQPQTSEIIDHIDIDVDCTCAMQLFCLLAQVEFFQS